MIAPMAAPRPPPITPPIMAPVAPPTIAPPTGSCAAASCIGIAKAMARQAEDAKARINPALLLVEFRIDMRLNGGGNQVVTHFPKASAIVFSRKGRGMGASTPRVFAALLLLEHGAIDAPRPAAGEEYVE